MSKQSSNITEMESLSTEQLKALLCRELDRKRIDHDRVQLILSILRERERIVAVEIPEQIAESWQRLQQEKIVPDRNAVQKKGLHALRIAAVLVLVFTLTLMVPRALGAENVFTVLGRWTDDFFSFVAPGESAPTEQEYVFRTDNPELQQVYDAVTAVGITYPVVPTWLPDGYALKEFYSKETGSGYKVTAVFKSVGDYIILSYDTERSGVAKYFKDPGSPVLYECGGVVYYVITNAGTIYAVWTQGNMEHCIQAPDQETLYRLIRSIHMEVQ